MNIYYFCNKMKEIKYFSIKEKIILPNKTENSIYKDVTSQRLSEEHVPSGHLMLFRPGPRVAEGGGTKQVTEAGSLHSGVGDLPHLATPKDGIKSLDLFGPSTGQVATRTTRTQGKERLRVWGVTGAIDP